MATHIRFRKKHGCPPGGKCQMPWYPYSTWAVFICMILIILSMPFISGQTSGLIAGVLMIVSFTACYLIQKTYFVNQKKRGRAVPKPGFSTEYGKELTDKPSDPSKKNNNTNY
jgi:L-asparagine transporter-like permease